MRMVIAAALTIGLAGCMTSEPPPPPGPPPGVNPEHDNHCRSLAMAPGSLVYVQCRLAMSQTQRQAEQGANALLTQEIGFVSPAVHSAMRDDIFCNYNESSKLSVQPQGAAEAALAAYNLCGMTRNRLRNQIATEQPMAAQTAMASYDRVSIATNEQTINEARGFR